ncbi:PH domain containing protein [Trichomonas vaginalis G3]|uniref:PH domain containing protein n=1 Tax=Trichomonas vaginalis (strain ATCC PRA-98 / G3) TaxID=412133 RepID=A2EI73_TRIV3|nr:protein ubiquitination [Trichomonas vaginalis G3]EAY07633.1 PH domain containing protein [Trichomonas vaginalis G3]KAI5500519.1 protein ubiquitination [Trichomonas vaginalis G3]|eukprot:XP_001319856.1 PH domain containing protein [Trichomonas vaginalis G3]
MQVLKCGWCKKEGHFVKNIKNRFLKLSPEKLSYYTDEAGKLKGEITIYDETKFISMETPEGLPMFLIEGKRNTKYKIFPPSLEERDDWLMVLRNCAKYQSGCRNPLVKESMGKIYTNYIKTADLLAKADDGLSIFTINYLTNKVKEFVYTYKEAFEMISYFAELNPLELKYYIKLTSALIKNLGILEPIESLGFTPTFQRLYEQYKDDNEKGRMQFYPGGDVRNTIMKDDYSYFKILPQAENPERFTVGDMSLLACAARYGAVRIFNNLLKKCKIDQMVATMAYVGRNAEIIATVRKDFPKINIDMVTIMGHYCRNAELYEFTTYKDVTAFPWIAVLTGYNMFGFFNKLFGLIALNDTDCEGNMIMHAAATVGIQTIINMLIEFGVAVDMPGKDKKTPFHLAIENLRFEAADILLSKGANINAVDAQGNTALIMASSKNNLDTIEYLIKNNADINVINNEGINALAESVRSNKAEVTKYLLDHGATDSGAKIEGQDILEFTVGKEYMHISRILIEHGANADNISIEKPINGLPPLVFAIQIQNMHVLNRILESHPPLDVIIQNKSFLNFAIEVGDLEIVKALVEAGIDVDANHTLADAIKYNHEDIAIYLLQNGANVESENEEGKNAKQIAIERGAQQFLDYLSNPTMEEPKSNKTKQQETQITASSSSEKVSEPPQEENQDNQQQFNEEEGQNEQEAEAEQEEPSSSISSSTTENDNEEDEKTSTSSD